MKQLLRRAWHKWLKPEREPLIMGELPEGFKDALISHTDIVFGWRDAVGILLGCQATVKCITYTQNRPGLCKSVSDISVWNPTQPFSGGYVEAAAGVRND